MNKAPTTTRQCPQCGATVTVDYGYTPWCDHCDWNIEPPATPRARKPTLFERLYTGLGKRMGKALLDEVLGTADLRPRFTLSRIAAFIIALPIHAITAAFAIFGLWAIFTAIVGWSQRFTVENIGLLIAAGLSLIIAKWLAPHLGKQPDAVLPRNSFAHVYGLADKVADALHARRVNDIAVDEYFNAGYTQVGLLRKRVLLLGLPLITSLNAEEMVALFSHELAHNANGDPNRSIVVGSAIASLGEWYSLLNSPPPKRGVSWMELLLRWVMRWFSVFPYMIAFILAHLTWRDSQRSEYLADYRGAQISGTRAQISLLIKTQLAEAYIHTAQRILERWSYDKHDLFTEWRRYVECLPEREIERLRRVSILKEAQMDTTHPPSGYRIQLLQHQQIPAAQVALSHSEFTLIQNEFKAIEPQMQNYLIDNYAR